MSQRGGISMSTSAFIAALSASGAVYNIVSKIDVPRPPDLAQFCVDWATALTEISIPSTDLMFLLLDPEVVIETPEFGTGTITGFWFRWKQGVPCFVSLFGRGFYFITET